MQRVPVRRAHGLLSALLAHRGAWWPTRFACRIHFLPFSEKHDTRHNMVVGTLRQCSAPASQQHAEASADGSSRADAAAAAANDSVTAEAASSSSSTDGAGKKRAEEADAAGRGSAAAASAMGGSVARRTLSADAAYFDAMAVARPRQPNALPLSPLSSAGGRNNARGRATPPPPPPPLEAMTQGSEAAGMLLSELVGFWDGKVFCCDAPQVEKVPSSPAAAAASCAAGVAAPTVVGARANANGGGIDRTTATAAASSVAAATGAVSAAGAAAREQSASRAVSYDDMAHLAWAPITTGTRAGAVAEPLHAPALMLQARKKQGRLAEKKHGIIPFPPSLSLACCGGGSFPEGARGLKAACCRCAACGLSFPEWCFSPLVVCSSSLLWHRGGFGPASRFRCRAEARRCTTLR